MGLDLPEPDALDDQQLTVVLWSVIQALAAIAVFISETDHLSDRELYTLLWRDVLREDVPLLAPDPGAASFVQLTSGGSEAGTHLYLKYYADEESRRHWLESFPNYDMPAHENPPYDRALARSRTVDVAHGPQARDSRALIPERRARHAGNGGK